MVLHGKPCGRVGRRRVFFIMSPLRAVPAIAGKLREWAFRFLLRRWRALLVLIGVLTALEFAARAYVLKRLAVEGRERGVDATADECIVTPFGVFLRGVRVSGRGVRGRFASVRLEWFPAKRLSVRDGEASIVRHAEARASEVRPRAPMTEFLIHGERIALAYEHGQKGGRCSAAALVLHRGVLDWSCVEASALVGGSRIVAHDLSGSFRAGRVTLQARRVSVATGPRSAEKNEMAAPQEKLGDPKAALSLLKASRARVMNALQAIAEAGAVRIDDAAVGEVSLGSVGVEWGGGLEEQAQPPVSAHFYFGGQFAEVQLAEFPVGRIFPSHPIWCGSDAARLTGRVRFSAADEVLSGVLEVKGLCAEHPRLADGPLRLHPLTLDFRVVPNAGEAWRVFATASQREAKLITEFVVAARATNPSLNLDLHVPEVRCQVAFEALPTGSWSRLGGTEFAGTFALDAKLSFDPSSKEDPKLDYTVSDQCRFVRTPQDVSRGVYRQPFQHKVYGPDGREAVRLAGPGTPGWAAYSRIGKFLPLAVVAMEDATFFQHRGFHHPSLKSALIANLRAGAFVRGGSTVTMQLAKNLFLTRRKTLFRKLEEILLADYLEQTFSKEELLELYLNVIEFGPNVYGVTAAAQYYFGTVPSDLSLGEALFLVSILPSPVKHAGMRAHGTVPDGWVRYLRRAADNLRRVGSIEPEDVEEAFRDPIGFVGRRKRPIEEAVDEPAP